MNRKRRFTASNNFQGLEEAIFRDGEDSDDGLEYDLAIIPPEPSVVTDEQEGFDDDVSPSSLPKDVPGNIEVFVHTVGSLSVSEKSSDNESLVVERARIHPGIPAPTQELSVPPSDRAAVLPVWRKCPKLF